MVSAQAEKSLVELGLTGLEAQVYTFLLQESPATGYRIAQALGKPAANVYKAIQTLQAKGAVEIDRGRTKVCRPVPVNDLLDQLATRFNRSRNQAAEVLRHLPGPEQDTRIYHLRDRDQVLGKCRQLLESAQKVVLLDIFPIPLQELRPDLAIAAARGITVTVKAYAPAEIPGVEVFVEPKHAYILDRWPAQWLNVVADGSEFMLGVLDKSGQTVIQAVWSGSPYLSWILHSGIGSEVVLTALRQQIGCGPEAGAATPSPQAEIAHQVQTWADRYITSDAPGYARLLNQLGLDVLRPSPDAGGSS
jgi:sugar-specific transcriptional regulator TrmB